MKHPMAEINDGGPAFPVQDAANWQSHGMSLRDYFAAKAMQGICTHHDTWGLLVPEITSQAYLIADNMLKERAK